MISVVLNVYKRPYMLERQIQAVKAQSVEIKSENIHVWYNKTDVAQYFPVDKDIRTYACNWNTKFWGRFSILPMLKTKFVAMFDDDILPQKDWFKNCVETIEKPESNGILGGSGVIVDCKGYYPHHKFGWNGGHSNKVERVDLVGHAWFFRQEWAKYMWYEKPYSWDNGEDITFSYLAQKYGNINTFVPPHPDNNQNLWSSDFRTGNEVGSDANASWRIGNHLDLRGEICVHCINNGWKTVNNIK
jgi:hypothetical protein